MAQDTLDGVLIDSDEGGFQLILSGEKQEYRFDLPQDIAIELMRAVEREIKPWWLEGEAVRQRLDDEEIRRIVAARDAQDTGQRLTLDELKAEIADRDRL